MKGRELRRTERKVKEEGRKEGRKEGREGELKSKRKRSQRVIVERKINESVVL